MQLIHFFSNEAFHPGDVCHRDVDARHAFECRKFVTKAFQRGVIWFQIMFVAGDNKTPLAGLSVLDRR